MVDKWLDKQLHPLLRQQLDLLNLSETDLPGETEWISLLNTISNGYAHNEQIVSRWVDAYHSIQEQLTGSYDNLKRSSADLLRNERDKFRTVIESMGEGLCSLNEHGVLIFMNPEATRLTGWHENELRGEQILDQLISRPDFGVSPTQRLLNKIRFGTPFKQDDALFLTRNNEPLPVSFTLNPVMKDGFLQGAVLTFGDIRALKQIQKQLENNLRRTLLLNRVISSTTSSFELQEILTSVCGQLAQFFDLPQAAFGILDEAKDQLTIIAEYLAPGRISALGQVIPVENNPATQAVLLTREPLYIEDAQSDVRVATQDSARRRGTRSMLLVPLLVRNQVLGTLGINSPELRSFSDEEIRLVQSVASAVSQALENAQLVTAVQQELAERKSTEIALAQARDSAIDASRLKSEFIAKVSHELRTPLASVIGFVEMLQIGLYGGLEEKQIETLDKIMQSSESLVTLVDDLLDVSQLEAGFLQIETDTFSPEELLSRVNSTLAILAEKKGLSYNADIDPNLPDPIQGDIDRLYQILMNLVGNSIKFTTDGGITVYIGVHDHERWSMSVSDTGIGIAPEMHSVIFDQFQQLKFAPVRGHRGVGLGLSIVKQLVELMHGEIELDSELGKGSRFTVILPLQPTR